MIAVVFPGQGSQKPGMVRSLVESEPAARDTFSQVSNAVGIDVEQLCFESDEETLRQTQNAQLALFTCGVAAFRVFERALPASVRQNVRVMAGHSIGEYAALVAAGVVALNEGAQLVRTRGERMAVAGRERPGTMAAVLGIERFALEEACREAGGVAVVANDNAPGQIVISGEADAVKRAGEIAVAKGAKRVIPLNVSGGFHSPLMEGAAREMGQALKLAKYGAPPDDTVIYSNVTAQPVVDTTQFPGLLERQLASPVRWTESVQNMVRDGVDTFVECGIGEVLSGLIRRIDKGARALQVQDAASLAATVAALQATQ